MRRLLNKYKTQIKYLIFGVLTTVVDFAISLLLYKFVNHHIANITAWGGAVIFAYVVNKIFVFESKRIGVRALTAEFGAFVGSRVFSLLLQEGIFLIAVDIMTLDKTLTKIGAAVVVVITNYFLSKMIFAKKKGQD